MVLTPKQEIFSQMVIKHKGVLSHAYQEAYPSANPESARHGGSALWKKVEIQTRVNEILEIQGLGIVELIKKLKDLTEARKHINTNGNFTGFVPDNSIRLEAIKVALHIHGLLGHKSDMIGLYLSPEQLEQLKKLQEPLTEEE